MFCPKILSFVPSSEPWVGSESLDASGDIPTIDDWYLLTNTVLAERLVIERRRQLEKVVGQYKTLLHFVGWCYLEQVVFKTSKYKGEFNTFPFLVERFFAAFDLEAPQYEVLPMQSDCLSDFFDVGCVDLPLPIEEDTISLPSDFHRSISSLSYPSCGSSSMESGRTSSGGPESTSSDVCHEIYNAGPVDPMPQCSRRWSDYTSEEDECELVPLSGDTLPRGEIPNEIVSVSATVNRCLESSYMSTDIPDLGRFIEEPVEFDGFDRVVAVNDWWSGMKLVPNLGIPDDSDVIFSGILSSAPEVMQSAIDEFLPLHHQIDDRFFQEIVETSDISLELENCSFDLSSFKSWSSHESGCCSSLNSGMTSTRTNTFREAALAIKKRNMNVPAISSSCDIGKVSDDVVEKFFSRIIDVDKLIGLPIIGHGELAWFADYLKGKPVNEDMFVDPICLVSMDKYRHMVKSQLKPVEDNSLAFERPLPATITYHDKGKVMSTSPLFLALMNRLLMSLKSKISIPTGKFHQLFSLDAQVFDSVLEWKEIDFSKFDKSQQELHHEVQKKIFLRLGLPRDFCDTWFTSHVRSHISDPSGLRFSVNFQRRTGDAVTYLGNTVVTLAVLSYVYDLSDPNVLMVVASGDDSLIGSYRPLDRSREHLCSTLFNFEAKFPHNQPFICSKFLLTMPTKSGGRRVVAVPNPLKLLIKLGIRNLQEDQFDAWYTSWIDLIHYFNDEHLISVVAEMCSYRYLRKPSMFLKPAMCSFNNVFANKTKLMKFLFPSMVLRKDKRKRPPRKR
ncbi:RNA-dependent RNA polymerase [Fragaria chiloensis latent virus]|uniref:RNA-directed RNA polymerase 2a n=1 Tax=Fragaria chiloensis latent virus TaxID=255238 RepID=Q5VI74_9BROM|nr:RNA-dependent RNA polymerase [Fragaria chiloensis latent virus]AAR24506.2 RNA-dependent RNA polymerase [Fragaria chiloensis latent virus]